jgi:tetratricopeptide (TPR) repeat protein
MRHILHLVLCLCPFVAGSQTVLSLFEQKKYPELIKHAEREKELTGEELYMVGFGFFQSGDDKKAISFYDKAISKNYNDPLVHFYKGISFRFLEESENAILEFDKAIKADSLNQEYVCEKAFTYYRMNNLEKALELYEQARKLPDNYQAQWYMIPHIYFLQEKDEAALKGFYEALEQLSTYSEHYIKTLMDIGKIEYVVKKDFEKASAAYSKVILMDPSISEAYPKLMKAYNAAQKYASADSIFLSYKKLYEAGMVDADTKKFKRAAVAEYKWNDQVIVVFKNFEAPKKTLDIIYKAVLLDKKGDKIERTFLTEQTFQIGKDDPKHLLCETHNGGHSTFPYGWKDDNFTVDDFMSLVKNVLDKEVKPSASSSFGSRRE